MKNKKTIYFAFFAQIVSAAALYFYIQLKDRGGIDLDTSVLIDGGLPFVVGLFIITCLFWMWTAKEHKSLLLLAPILINIIFISLARDHFKSQEQQAASRINRPIHDEECNSKSTEDLALRGLEDTQSTAGVAANFLILLNKMVINFDRPFRTEKTSLPEKEFRIDDDLYRPFFLQKQFKLTFLSVSKKLQEIFIAVSADALCGHENIVDASLDPQTSNELKQSLIQSLNLKEYNCGKNPEFFCAEPLLKKPPPVGCSFVFADKKIAFRGNIKPTFNECRKTMYAEVYRTYCAKGVSSVQLTGQLVRAFKEFGTEKIYFNLEKIDELYSCR